MPALELITQEPDDNLPAIHAGASLTEMLEALPAVRRRGRVRARDVRRRCAASTRSGHGKRARGSASA